MQFLKPEISLKILFLLFLLGSYQAILGFNLSIQTFIASLGFLVLSTLLFVLNSVPHSIILGMMMLYSGFTIVLGNFEDAAYTYQSGIFSPEQVHNRFIKKQVTIKHLRGTITNPYSKTQLEQMVSVALTKPFNNQRGYVTDLIFDETEHKPLTELNTLILKKTELELVETIVLRACYTPYNKPGLAYLLELYPALNYSDCHKKIHKELRDDND